MLAFRQRVSQMVIKAPAVPTFFARTGGGGGGFGGANTGRLSVNLKPRRERKETVVDIVNRMRPKLGVITGLQISMSIPQSIRIGGRLAKSRYDYTLYGPDTKQLYVEGAKLEQVIARLPGLFDVTRHLQIKKPHIAHKIHRDHAAP